MDKIFNKPFQNNPPDMVIRVVAECSKCGGKETLYVSEKTKNTIEHECPICENNKFVITYR